MNHTRSTRYGSALLRYDYGCFQDVAATLATEEAEDASQVTKLRSALESVEYKRLKVSYQSLVLLYLGAGIGGKKIGFLSVVRHRLSVGVLIRFSL